MFKAPFSLRGRITRTEFGLTHIIFSISGTVIFLAGVFSESQAAYITTLILLLAAGWFRLAQGTKRCHDIDISGWYQLIPLFTIVLLAQKGKLTPNKYGASPKTIIVDEVCTILSVKNGHIVVQTTDGKRIVLQNITLPDYARVGDLVQHVENGYYTIVDKQGNMIFRM
jgi:uncharacterized membrane protein YhaH (DUF805 family)